MSRHTENIAFSLAYLAFAVLGKTGSTAARSLSIVRNMYYLLKH